MIDIINTNRVLIEPFSDAVHEALLQYSQTVLNNSEAREQRNANVCLNETFDKSTQNDITVDVSIPQPYSLVSDDEINANILQREVFDFVYSWAKETAEQKSSVKQNQVKPFRLFLSNFQKGGA